LLRYINPNFAITTKALRHKVLVFVGIKDEILYSWFTFFSIFNFVILRVLGAFVVQMLFLTALFGINAKKMPVVSL